LKLIDLDSKTYTPEIDTANESFSLRNIGVSQKNSELLSKKPLELYPGMGKPPLKSILKKVSSNNLKDEELFISKVSLKNDEKAGKLQKSHASSITFKEEPKISFVTSYKQYNETGEFSSDSEGNCNCVIY